MNFKAGQRVWSKEYNELATVHEIGNTASCRIIFDDGETHSVFIMDLHQTAHDMFEELGYEDCERTLNTIVYKSNRFTITFDTINKEYWHDNDTSLTVEEHKAIHQMMIELGWL